MTLYAKELSARLLTALNDHIDTSDFDKDGNEYLLRDSLHGAELKAVKTQFFAELTDKNWRLTLVEYKAEITVSFEFENAVHEFTVKTNEEWLDDIIDLLYSALVDEIHRLRNPNEEDLEDDEKENV